MNPNETVYLITNIIHYICGNDTEAMREDEIKFKQPTYLLHDVNVYPSNNSYDETYQVDGFTIITGADTVGYGFKSSSGNYDFFSYKKDKNPNKIYEIQQIGEISKDKYEVSLRNYYDVLNSVSYNETKSTPMTFVFDGKLWKRVD